MKVPTRVIIASAPMTEAEMLSMYQDALNDVTVVRAIGGDPDIDDALMAALTKRGLKIVGNAIAAAPPGE